jgi:hypothetical protein
MRRNCWTCKHASHGAAVCLRPWDLVGRWVECTHNLRESNECPRDADGCPGWEAATQPAPADACAAGHVIPTACPHCAARGPAAPLPVSAALRIDAYAVVASAVEAGIARGWRRAHKHTEAPGEHGICEAMEQGVMEALCEVVRFGDEGRE